jgi:hypothetical protein
MFDLCNINVIGVRRDGPKVTVGDGVTVENSVGVLDGIAVGVFVTATAAVAVGVAVAVGKAGVDVGRRGASDGRTGDGRAVCVLVGWAAIAAAGVAQALRKNPKRISQK